MSSALSKDKRILAIDPAGRGFGFAVFEGPDHLVDWGVRGAKARNHTQAIAHLEELVDYYGPDVIVTQKIDNPEVHRGFRARAFLREALKVSAAYQVPVRTITSRDLVRAFSDLGYPTKHKIATRIGELFPELAPRVPPFRKPWMSEDYRMAIFDAVAFGLTYFRRGRPRPLETGPTDLAA
jgi:RNase H-fold protein (predicted Holliday junction resolvase)